MTEQCSYEDCSKESVTELEINDESRPVCHGHITDMVQEHTEDQEDEEEGDGPGRYPVMTNSDDQAAWINTDKNNEAYLSVKISDGEYVNLFSDSDALQIVLNQIHEVKGQ